MQPSRVQLSQRQLFRCPTEPEPHPPRAQNDKEGKRPKIEIEKCLNFFAETYHEILKPVLEYTGKTERYVVRKATTVQTLKTSEATSYSELQ